MKFSANEMCNCFTVRQASRRITRLYESHLAKAALTSAQFSLLVLLGEKPGMTMSEIAGVFGMDRTTLVRAIKPLQRDGLIKSLAGDGDPRLLRLSLTEDGGRKLQQSVPLWRAAQDEFEAQVGTERAARLRRDLLAFSQ